MEIINFSDRKISSAVASQLPNFISEEKETFIQFLKAYYEYMEEEKGSLNFSKNIANYLDISRTVDDYVDFFMSKIADSVPLNIQADKRKFARLINRLYTNKGTIESYKFLFRALYNEEIDIYTPGDDMLIVSGSTWTKRNIIRVTAPESIFDTLGLKITGLSSEATATVDFIRRENIASINIINIFLSDVNGVFSENEIFEVENLGIRGKILPVVTGFTINNGGTGYVAGDSVTITDTIGKGALAEVKSVDRVTGRIKSITIKDFGILYTPSTTATVSSQTGINADIDITVGGLGISDGEYTQTKGHLSSDKYIQDSKFYQQFSYVIRSGQSINFYRETLKQLLHPAGVALFGQVLINQVLPLRTTTANVNSVVRFYRNLIALSLSTSVYLEKDIYPDLPERIFQYLGFTDHYKIQDLEINGGVLNVLDFALKETDLSEYYEKEKLSIPGLLLHYRNISLEELSETPFYRFTAESFNTISHINTL